MKMKKLQIYLRSKIIKSTCISNNYVILSINEQSAV